MKKRILFTILVMVVLLFSGMGFQDPQLQADKGSSTEKPFEIKKDGKVTIDGLEFKNLSEYFNSEYFRVMGKRCGTKHRHTNRKLELPNAAASDCTGSRTIIRNEYYPTQTYTIPIVFHIIRKTDGTGNISDQRINDQIEVLNQDYGATAGTLGAQGYNSKIQFQLAGITRTTNNSWYNDQNESAYKSALGWNRQQYLNVWTNTASGNLGYSSFPQDDAGDSSDGIVMLHSVIGGRDMSMPGDLAQYDQGRTLVHEAGHYLGLEHTFNGYGCFDGYQAGDLIADTNSENDEHYGCSQTNTCGTADPIRNYMNYTDDSCMREFTQEQANRMVCSMVNYRPNLYTSSSSQESITVTAPNGGESWTVASSRSITWTSTGTVGNVKIRYSTNNGGNWSTVTSSTSNDGSYSWTVPNAVSSQCLVKIEEASDGSPSDTSNAVFSITSSSSGTGEIALSRSQLYFGAVSGGASTGSQPVRVDNSGGGSLQWTAVSSASWLNRSPSSGSDGEVISVSVNASGLSTGSYSGTVTVTDSSASNSPQTVTVSLDVISSAWDADPFGAFSTPTNGSTVRSSVPVTGWVLDDVGVESVKIYRGQGSGMVYIGDAVFVDGARPDVEQAYPGYPQNYQAGWGYMLLSNFLPNGGNGTYTLTAIATDVSGWQTTLGTKTVTVDNAGAVKPFGAIDSPASGGSASGSSYRNAGWVLTPQPNEIPTDGSTINVYVNGAYLGNPVYNVYRSDIAGYFPGYANSNGAHGYFYLDTTAYSNGVHSIYWTVEDDGGNADGIGSRYFTIQNTGNRVMERRGNPVWLPGPGISGGPVGVITGYGENKKPRDMFPGDNGVITVETRELERVVFHLSLDSEVSKRWVGGLEVGDVIKRLPIGSTLDMDRGIFYWQPGPGFTGLYRLVFMDETTKRVRKVNVKIGSRY